MQSRIEQLIDEIEDYIDSCKYQPLSNTKIIVNKEEIDTLLNELRTKTPEELARYQKVVSNQQAILKDAREKAEELINKAAAQTNEMVNQNSIMKQAYIQADEVVKSAYQQAQQILTQATEEANALRTAAVDYMDNMLASYESLVAQTMNLTQSHYESFYTQLNQYYEVVVSNRMELKPPAMDTAEIPVEYMNMEDTGSISSGIQQTGQIQNPGQNTGNINQSAVNKVNQTVNPTTDNSGDIKLDLL